MKNSISILLLILTILPTCFGAEEDWLTDITEAVEKAKDENKLVLVTFTGSDWCPPCKKIHEEVFSKENFVKQAKEKFVLCIIDSPDKDKELTNKNKPFKDFTRFNPASFDTIDKMMDQLSYQVRRKDMF